MIVICFFTYIVSIIVPNFHSPRKNSQKITIIKSLLSSTSRAISTHSFLFYKIGNHIQNITSLTSWSVHSKQTKERARFPTHPFQTTSKHYAKPICRYSFIFQYTQERQVAFPCYQVRHHNHAYLKTFRPILYRYDRY